MHETHDHAPFECGLCGDLVTQHDLTNGLHACCGCGFRDASLDGKPWVCLNCG